MSRQLLSISFSCVLLLAWVRPAGASEHPDATQAAALQQVAGILDYIAGDYRGAVSSDGRILDATEYAEQRSLAKDADALAAEHAIAKDAELRVTLAAIANALEQRHAPSDVAASCRVARDLIEHTYGVSLAPSAVPSRGEAMQLYRAQTCNTCHGDDGGANTPLARSLDPHPANFLDAQRVATVSAHRAFHAISHGVPGTAMRAFDALSETQRWSLAFYVLSLRHASADVAEGRRVFDAADKPTPNDARGLASLTEEELIAKLAKIPDAKARANALSYLRAEAPFAQDQARGSLALSFQKLDQGLTAYGKGDRAGARQLFVSAYLDGFEPHEAALRAKNAALVSEVENAMLALRSVAARGAAAQDVQKQAAIARSLLARAEAEGHGKSAALLGALTITLREGLEIVLLVTALLALVRKRGHAELAKFVHIGWLLAIPAGLATYWFAGSIFGGMQRELSEGIASLLAAVVLLGVTHWLLGQLGAKQWVGFLARHIGAATAQSTRSAALGVLGFAFLAAYREAFEIVLFFQALVLDSAGAVHDVWIGAGIGLLLLSVIATALLRVGQRLKPAPFMLASSVFLALLALVLVGKGVRALQEAGVLGINPLPWPELPVAGIFATHEGLLAQAVLLFLLTLSALAPWLKARRAQRNHALAAE